MNNGYWSSETSLARHLVCFGLMTLLLILAAPSYAQNEVKPNFLVIVADDMGWSDIGMLGGDIRTPHIDALAKEGAFHTDFYVAPTCAPTRAMLMTGVSNHRTGVATQDGQQAENQLGNLNYAGELHEGVSTIPEVLKAAGYASFMVGKWHLAISNEQLPSNRGFDRTFVLKEGGASHFGDGLQINPVEGAHYFEDGQPTRLPRDFYSTVSYTGKMIEFLTDPLHTDKPFFAYVAYTAPHDPLQVPSEWADRYANQFDAGPRAIRAKRLEHLKEKGFVSPGAPLVEGLQLPRFLPSWKPDWEDRSENERKIDARPMEIYASMVELMDQQIGRLLAELKAQGKLKNTFVIFLSDNGGSSMTPLFYPGMTREWLFENRDLSLANMGRPGSHTYYGSEWASTSNTPWNWFKGLLGEGGIRTPLIVSGPDVARGKVQGQLTHVSDIAPTLYELAGIETNNNRFSGSRLAPTGLSLASLWKGEESGFPRTIASELFGNKMVRKSQWKLMQIQPPFGAGQWELYNLKADPTEMHDVSGEHPDLVAELRGEYSQFEKANEIIHPHPIIKRNLSNTYVAPCDWVCMATFEVAQLVAEFIR